MVVPGREDISSRRGEDGAPAGIPASLHRPATRVKSVLLGIARLGLAGLGIYLLLESHSQGNYLVYRFNEYFTFYWTDALIIFLGLLGIVCGIIINKHILGLHVMASSIIGGTISIMQMIIGSMGCYYDGHGVNPTPGYYTDKWGNRKPNYIGNDANRGISAGVVCLGIAELFISLMVFAIHGEIVHFLNWSEENDGERDASVREQTPVQPVTYMYRPRSPDPERPNQAASSGYSREESVGLIIGNQSKESSNQSKHDNELPPSYEAVVGDSYSKGAVPE